MGCLGFTTRGLCGLSDHGVAGNLPWYAMELVPGGALRSWLSPNAAPRSLTEPQSALPWWTSSLGGAALAPHTNPDSVFGDINGHHTAGLLPLEPRLKTKPASPVVPVRILPGIPAGWPAGSSWFDISVYPSPTCMAKDSSTGISSPTTSWSGPMGAQSWWILDCSRTSEERSAGRFFESSGILAGTAYYMAPEQIRGELVDARTDLYSLGCLMYELITERRTI